MATGPRNCGGQGSEFGKLSSNVLTGCQGKKQVHMGTAWKNLKDGVGWVLETFKFS